MKLTALALALASVAAVPVMAADLPSRAPPPVFVPPAPIFTWTGFYIGGTAGVTFGGKNSLFSGSGGGNYTAANGVTYTNINSNNTSNRNNIGFTGGGEIGYNYQIGSIVIGIEADAQYIDRGRNGTNQNAFVALTNTQYQVTNLSNNNNNNSNNFFGTARARVGYAFDRLLIFATGGFAYDFGGSNSGNTTQVAFGPANATTVLAPGGIYNGINNGDRANLGYTVGGGLEYAIFGNFTVKGEYLYTQLGSRNTTFVGVGPAFPNGASFVAKTSNQFSVARVGINYKF